MKNELLELGFNKYNRFYELNIGSNKIQVVDGKIYLFENESNFTSSFYNIYNKNKVVKLIKRLKNA